MWPVYELFFRFRAYSKRPRCAALRSVPFFGDPRDESSAPMVQRLGRGLPGQRSEVRPQKTFFAESHPTVSIFGQARWPGQALSGSGPRLSIGALWQFFQKRNMGPNLRPWRPRTRHLDRHTARATPVISPQWGTPAHRWNRAEAAHQTRAPVFESGPAGQKSIFRPTSPKLARKNKFFYRSSRLVILYNFSLRT